MTSDDDVNLTQGQLLQLRVSAGNVLSNRFRNHHELRVVLDLLHLLRIAEVHSSVDVPTLETSDRRRELGRSVARRHDEFYLWLRREIFQISTRCLLLRYLHCWTFTFEKISKDFIRVIRSWWRFILVQLGLLLLDNNLSYCIVRL